MCFLHLAGMNMENQPILLRGQQNVPAAVCRNGGSDMPRPRGESGERNIISGRLKQLRAREKLSQRDLACALQCRGLDLDKNVITRIETNKRYVTDLELKGIADFFGVSYDYLLGGGEKQTDPPPLEP